MKTRSILLLGLALSIVDISYMAMGDDHDIARRALQNGEVLPLMEILKLSEKYVTGDIIEVELENKKDKIYYEIKFLEKSGKVMELFLDARTGAYIKLRAD
ncbi:PepSY domain-containing protein [Kordiimonas pumila]|uniref:PepSY domain-containing protein n=1 Tax=Kordiimonas pumila TaxID=2161677 RepID=A0ABV7D5P3_9PROT|nr:PepSY domain-containing protein [Kordiimonas pumila]